jgi:hypothetical protein
MSRFLLEMALIFAAAIYQVADIRELFCFGVNFLYLPVYEAISTPFPE